MTKPGKIIPKGTECKMLPVNVTCVCWDCRTTARRPEFGDHPATCPTCGKKMVALTKGLRIPRRNDDKGWESLRRLVSSRNRASRTGVDASQTDG